MTNNDIEYVVEKHYEKKFPLGLSLIAVAIVSAGLWWCIIQGAQWVTK